MEYHVYIWIFFFITAMSVYLCDGDTGTLSKTIWVLFQVAWFLAGLSTLAGFIKLFLLLLGY